MRILILILTMSLKTGPTTLCYFFFQKKAFGKVEKRKNHYGAFQAKKFEFVLRKVLAHIEAFGAMLGQCMSGTPLSFVSKVEVFFEEVELTDRR